jgi:hypothetical protein
LAITDRIAEWIGAVAEAIRRRLGIKRYYTIYQYVVRASGWVEPPKEMKRKETDPLSAIQFELSFETAPFFRTFLDNYEKAMEKYEGEIEALVKEQEVKAMRFRPPALGYVKPMITSVYLVPKDVLEEIKKELSKEELERMATTGLVRWRMPLRPTFHINKIDFEPYGSFDVEVERVKEGKAVDVWVFKLYRPDEIEEKPTEKELRRRGWIWSGAHLHDL